MYSTIRWQEGGDGMEKAEFSLRLAKLRVGKGVSAREMSLALGQSAGYINNLETGVSFPSMSVFFYICEYLGVTPAEFFTVDSQDPIKENELAKAVKGLKREQVEMLIALAKDLKK